MAPTNTYTHRDVQQRVRTSITTKSDSEFHTSRREFFMAITAAMKKVLSPISDAKITPQDFRNPSKNRLVVPIPYIVVYTIDTLVSNE